MRGVGRATLKAAILHTAGIGSGGLNDDLLGALNIANQIGVSRPQKRHHPSQVRITALPVANAICSRNHKITCQASVPQNSVEANNKNKTVESVEKGANLP